MLLPIHGAEGGHRLDYRGEIPRASYLNWGTMVVGDVYLVKRAKYRPSWANIWTSVIQTVRSRDFLPPSF